MKILYLLDVDGMTIAGFVPPQASNVFCRVACRSSVSDLLEAHRPKYA